MHVLDNAAWHALTGPHARAGRTRRPRDAVRARRLALCGRRPARRPRVGGPRSAGWAGWRGGVVPAWRHRSTRRLAPARWRHRRADGARRVGPRRRRAAGRHTAADDRRRAGDDGADPPDRARAVPAAHDRARQLSRRVPRRRPGGDGRPTPAGAWLHRDQCRVHSPRRPPPWLRGGDDDAGGPADQGRRQRAHAPRRVDQHIRLARVRGTRLPCAPAGDVRRLRCSRRGSG